MPINPYKKPRPHRPLGYLLDSDLVLLEDGQTQLVGGVEENVQIWAPSERLRELTRAGHGSALLWRYAVIGWSPHRDAADWPIRGLSLDAPESPEETLAELGRWRDWLESYGAAPAGSLGGSGLSLLKASLSRPLWTASGDCPPITYALGGRQESAYPAPSHRKGNLVQSDIQAAYANTLGGLLYGGRWSREPWAPIIRRRADVNPGLLVYVRARVTIPDLGEKFPQLRAGHRGPLVARPRKAPSSADQVFTFLDDRYPSGKTLQGIWTLEELDAAEDAGCKVKPLEAWVHNSGERPFETWLERIHEGRSLGGFAGTLAKATGNATWGQFAIGTGRRQVVAVGRDDTLPLRGGNPSMRAYDLAEAIAGSVRARLYRGMWSVGRDLITAHTDGLWSENGRVVLGWRVSDRADELRLFDAQHYATRIMASPWEYTVAGVLDPEAWFEETWSRTPLGQFQAKQREREIEPHGMDTSRRGRARSTPRVPRQD